VSKLPICEAKPGGDRLDGELAARLNEQGAALEFDETTYLAPLSKELAIWMGAATVLCALTLEFLV